MVDSDEVSTERPLSLGSFTRSDQHWSVPLEELADRIASIITMVTFLFVAHGHNKMKTASER